MITCHVADEEDIRADHFNIHNVPQRVAKQRKDPWTNYWKTSQALPKKNL